MEKVIVYDPLENFIYEFENIDEAKKWILESFTDKEDGIHPEIESVLILKKTHEIVVTEDTEREHKEDDIFDSYHNIEFKNISKGEFIIENINMDNED